MQALSNPKPNNISSKSYLYKLLGKRHLLWLWYQSKRECVISLKDFRLFTSPIKKEEENEVFLWHAPSCRYTRLTPPDAWIFRLAMSDEKEAKSLIEELSLHYTTAELAAAFQRHTILMNKLEAISTPPPSTMEPPPQKGEMLMFGNLLCNLKCAYCLSRDAREEADKGKAPKLMPLETARQSVRFIAEKMTGKAEHIYINFTLGGEPLLSFDRYRLLRDYCSEVSDEFGIPVTLNMNTNGTAFTDGFIDYCEQNGVTMAISIDGPQEIHDAMRPFQSGRGSYDAIVKNLPRILNSGHPDINNTAAGAVLTALNPYPKPVYQHLIELGFRHVVVTPVRDDPDREWSLNEKTTKAFQDSYTEYAEWLLECLVNEDDRIYAAVIEHDFFGRYLIRVLRGTKQPYRCEAGRTTFGVGIDGGLYPCDSFVKLPQYRLGDVFNGIYKEKQSAFLKDTMTDEKPVCRDCWARYQCGGGGPPNPKGFKNL